MTELLPLTAVRLSGDLQGLDDSRSFLLALADFLAASHPASHVTLLPEPDLEDFARVPFLVEVYLGVALSLEDMEYQAAAQDVAHSVRGFAREWNNSTPGMELRIRSMSISALHPYPPTEAQPLLAHALVSTERLDDQEAAVALQPLPVLSRLEMASGAIAFVLDKEKYPWPTTLDGHWRRIFESHFLWRNPSLEGDRGAMAEILLTLAGDDAIRIAPMELIKYLVSIGGPRTLTSLLT